MAEESLAIRDDRGDSATGDEDAAAPKRKKKRKGLLERLKLDEESVNLVPDLMDAKDGKGGKSGEDILEAIAKQVRTDFDADWESTESYRTRHAEDWRLLEGVLKQKDWPFKHAANAHVPLYLIALSRILFRAYDELFGDWTSVFGVLPVGPDDDNDADILTRHGNWQIREQILDFKRQMMRAMMLFFSDGDVVTHSYYDPFTKIPCHDTLTCDDFVVPYVHVTVSPNYSDVPHRTRILHKYRHELQAMRDTWHGVDEVLKKKPAHDDEPDSVWREIKAHNEGIEMPTDDSGAAYKLLWYEGWTQHLSDDDEDDRFIQAIVDYRTKRILSLLIHEEANWQDQRRFEQQTQELDKYRQDVQAHAQAQQQQQEHMQNLQELAVGTEQSGLPLHPDHMQQAVGEIQSELNPPPIPPAWIENPDDPNASPEKPRKEPIHMFAHGVCLEPIMGNLGLGFGRMEADLNKAANTALSQFIDQATLGNAKSYLYDGNMELPRQLDVGPGVFNPVRGSVANLKDKIFPLDPGTANPQLAELVDRFKNYSEGVAQAPEVLSGESGKSGETARGLFARIEQATKQLSVPTRLFAMTILDTVLKNNAFINSIFLRDEEIVMVNNHLVGRMEELRLGRKLYQRDYRVQFTSDLRFVSRSQRVAEADEISQMVMAFPPLQGDIAFLHKALTNSLKARGQFSLIPYMGPPPPPPTTPFGLQPPAPPGIVPPSAQPGAPGGQPQKPNGSQPQQGPRAPVSPQPPS